jgi:hypothetical protein
MNESSNKSIFDSLIEFKNSLYKFNQFIINFKKFLSYNPEDTFNSNPVSEGKKPFKLQMTEHGSFYLEDEQIPKISTGNAAGDTLAVLCKNKSYFTSDSNILKAYGNPDEEVSKILYDLKRSLKGKGVVVKYQRTNSGYEITQCRWIE